ncbi:6815_t:CDS:2 [Diversispora eburnea]|uniref:6815_t:CDS:1 n=1 Tax=Diversispora eburnea TaxID=1213867 RepID=A0A9N8Z0J5_9GLOM|nr:6815_t:CDS:2 [Diversispora eburnea]
MSDSSVCSDSNLECEYKKIDSNKDLKKRDFIKDETSSINTSLTKSSYEDILDQLISKRHYRVTNCSGDNENNDDDDEDTNHFDPDQNKLKILFGLLKNFIGVKDMVSLRISLPSQLLEPIGNLEYWNYNDRPDYLICIGDSDDPLERMLAAIRWWFSRDLKYVKGKIIKPYNSILGEQFICHWDVTTPKFDERGHFINHNNNKNGFSNNNDEIKYRVTCLNEQISHHPPVSAFHYNCEETGVSAYGIDQIVARFTGTSVKIGPGEQNKGIYINLVKRGNEEYLITHPTASLQGWLKASLYIVLGESCIMTCPKTKLKAILEYKEEKWLGKPKFAIEGKIFRYDPENDDNIKKLRSVDENNVLAEIIGSWRGKVHAKRLDTDETKLLIDMEKLVTIPKIVRPIIKQGPLESRNIWKPVSMALFQRDYTTATMEKIVIEEKQRQKAMERKARNEEYDAMYFKLPVIDGKPILKETSFK